MTIKTTATAAVLLLIACAPAQAGDWTREDTAWEAAYLVLHVVDWGQTRYITKNPDRYRESNSILGETPSLNRVRNYFIATALLHASVSYALPPQWRRRWQGATIAVQAYFVGHNYGADVRIDF
jgi:hypothetical protein